MDHRPGLAEWEAFDLQDADAALRNGDLATYQAKTNEAKQALADALRQMGR